jgi:hypothetical protein
MRHRRSREACFNQLERMGRYCDIRLRQSFQHMGVGLVLSRTPRFIPRILHRLSYFSDPLRYDRAEHTDRTKPSGSTAPTKGSTRRTGIQRSLASKTSAIRSKSRRTTIISERGSNFD